MVVNTRQVSLKSEKDAITTLLQHLNSIRAIAPHHELMDMYDHVLNATSKRKSSVYSVAAIAIVVYNILDYYQMTHGFQIVESYAQNDKWSGYYNITIIDGTSSVERTFNSKLAVVTFIVQYLYRYILHESEVKY